MRKAFRPGKRRKVLQPRSARHQGHPHPLLNGADIHRHPVPDEGKTRTPRPSPITRNHEKMVERNLSELAEAKPELVRGEVEIYKDKMTEVVAQEQAGKLAPMTPAKRAQHVALETHREMASTILSAGGTFEEAADHAGTTAATVRKWYEEPDFRARVDEHRAVVKGRVGGRIEAWMDARTASPEALEQADPKVTLAIYDRVAGRPGSARQDSGQPAVNVNILSYSDLMERSARTAAQRSASAEVDVVDAGGEGRGFPLIGAGGLPVAGEGARED